MLRRSCLSMVLILLMGFPCRGFGQSISDTSARLLPGGREGNTYRLTLPASGGVPPYTWRVVEGDLPPGLALRSKTGEIDGTATKAGSYRFRLDVADSRGTQVNDEVVIRIEPPQVGVAPLRFRTTEAPAAVRDRPYRLQLAIEGGVPPFVCTTSETLPPGLALSADTCEITGTPTDTDDVPVTLTATDSQASPASTSQQLALSVVGPGIASWWIVLATLAVVLAALAIRNWYNRGKCWKCGKYGRIKWVAPNQFYCPKHPGGPQTIEVSLSRAN